jgi:hypothetical protein
MPPKVRRTVAAFVMGLLLLPSFQSSAHEVPRELKVEAFVKPQQNSLHLLIRIPLHGLLGTGLTKEGLGYLSLATIGPSLDRTARQIADLIEVYEGGRRLAAPRIVASRISLPFDQAFKSYDQAAALLAGPPLPVETQVYWMQGNFDAWFDYPIQSEHAGFSVHPQLTSLAPEVTTSLRFVAPEHSVRSFEYLGDAGRVWLEPRWYQAVPRFSASGFLSSVGTADHWLLALCLLIPWRRTRVVLLALGAFAVGCVLTGIVVTYGPDSTGTWLAPLVVTALAGLILYLAIENIANGRNMRRWPSTCAFGVLTGLSTSLVLRQLEQFAGDHVLVSVLSFTLGITFGAMAALAVVAALLALLYRYVKAQRLRTIVLSALVAHFAFNSLMLRASALSTVQWPLPTTQNMVTATSWMLVIVAAAGCVWILTGVFTHGTGHQASPQAGAENRPA